MLARVLARLDGAHGLAIDVFDGGDQAGLVLGDVIAAAGLLDGGLPLRIGNPLAKLLVVVGANEEQRDLVVDGALQDVVKAAAVDNRRGVFAIREDHHQVARGLEIVEGLEDLDALLKSAGNHGARLGELRELDRIANQRHAQQQVVVVAGERGDDVGAAAKLDQRHQVAMTAPAP